MYFPGAANLVANALSRLHHPVSATLAATISIHTMELQIIGAEEWKEEMCELPVEDAYFGPIVNVLHKEADETEVVGNQPSHHMKDKHQSKTWCDQDCYEWIVAFVLAGILGHSASHRTCRAMLSRNLMTLRSVVDTIELDTRRLPLHHNCIGLIIIRPYRHGLEVRTFDTVSSIPTNSRMARCNWCPLRRHGLHGLIWIWLLNYQLQPGTATTVSLRLSIHYPTECDGMQPWRMISMQRHSPESLVTWGFEIGEVRMILSLIAIRALCQISGDPWWPNWESHAVTAPPIIRKLMAMRRIWMQWLNAILWCTWLSAQMSGTTCYRWLSSPTTQRTIRLSRLLCFGPKWDSCRGCQLICWYQSRGPTGCQKSGWTPMWLLNRWCQISACWESGWSKHNQRWFSKLICLTTSTISRWETQFVSTPAASRSAMQILLTLSRHIIVPESFNILFAGCFASPKPSVPALSCWTPHLTGRYPMFSTSPVWNEIVWITVEIILCHSRWTIWPTRIRSMSF